MREAHCSIPNQQGFTLIELITVMLIVGILSAVAFSRFADNRLYTHALFNSKMQAYLKSAQQRAMAQQTPFAKATSLSLKYLTDTTWEITISNAQGAQVFNLENSDEIIFNSEKIAPDTQLRFIFKNNGDIASYQLLHRNEAEQQHNYPYTHSQILQIGSQPLCIVPTGYSYAGPCS